MVIVGERVEEGLKSGKIKWGSSVHDGAKKPFNGYQKEGDTTAISSQKGRAQ